MKKITLDDFLERSNNTHGEGKYDYDKVILNRGSDKIIIGCKLHGDFIQTAYQHTYGKGCPECGIRRSNKEEFTNKADKIYGNDHDYSSVEYVNAETKVTIICKKHGEFEQTPHSYLKGHGCKICSNFQSNNAEFILKSNEVHDNGYIYDKCEYISATRKVIITCTEHGDFEQTPNNHLAGKGCMKCGGREVSNNEKFIKRSDLIHDGLYTYEKVSYKNEKEKVIITCNKHGDFEQTPKNHLSGHGCTICKSSKGELKIRSILKENNIKYISEYTFKDLKYKYVLRFDFGIIDDNGNLLYLIEFNGIQHYEYIEFFHRNNEGFEKYQLKDKMKSDYCIKKGIKLLIIKFDDNIYNKIEIILNEVSEIF